MKTDLQIYHFAGDGVGNTFSLRLDGHDIPVTTLPNLSAQDCQSIAAEYAKLPSYCHLEPRYISVHYAHVAADADLDVELAISEPIRNFTIHPIRRGIKATVAGNTLRFVLDQRRPRYLIIELNDLPPFCLIVDPPETGAPSPGDKGVVNAASFLNDATGTIDQTQAFAAALSAASGGKTLYVPPGIYLTNTITLHNLRDLSIYLAPGCLIRTITSPPGHNLHTQGIWIDRCSNIRIFGRGYLDHQAYENYFVAGNTYNHLLPGELYVPIISQAPVLIMRSQDITVEGLCVRNARIFGFNILDCDRVALRDCKMLTPSASTPESTDSIDVDASDSVTIDCMLAYGNDDCFAWGNPSVSAVALGRPADLDLYYPYGAQARSRNLTRCVVRGMVGWNPRANGVRLGGIGGDSTVAVRDLLFENCDFAGFRCSGLFLGRLKDTPPGTPAPRYGQIRFTNCGFDAARATEDLINAARSRFDLLAFDQVTFSDSHSATVIQGPDDNSAGQLTLRNVTINGNKLTAPHSTGIDIKNIAKVTIE